jgi:hypothetical protein
MKKMRNDTTIRTFILAILTLSAIAFPTLTPHGTTSYHSLSTGQLPPIAPLVSGDFSVSASPDDIALPQGSSGSNAATATILLNSLNGFSGTVNLAAAVTPTGPTASVSPNSVNLSPGGSCSPTLTISTRSSTPTGLYNVNVTASSGSLNHSFVITLAVTPLASTISNTQTFTGVSVLTTGSLSLDSPSSTFTFSGTASVLATNATTGATLFSTTYTITQYPFVSYQSSYQAWVILNIPVSRYPLSSNLVVTLSTSGLQTSAYSLSRNLDVNGDGNDNRADYPIFIAAFGCSIGQSCYNPIADINGDGIVNISDVAAWAYFYGAQNFGVANYRISASPTTLIINVGSSSTSTITLNSQYGFAGNVNLAATVSPTGPTTSFNPASITLSAGGSGTSTLTVATTSSTLVGSYAVTVNATSGTRWHTVSLTVNVVDFALTANPVNLSIARGSSGTSTISANAINGFPGTVNLTSASTPSGLTLSIGPPRINCVPCGGSSTLTISTTSTTPTGLYNVNVTGTNGALSHSLIIQVAITPITFTLSDTETFTGVTVQTSGTLSVDSPANAFTVSGTVTVVATNATTGVTLFSKTYTVTRLPFGSSGGGYTLPVVFNVAVNPYPLGERVALNLSSPTSTTPGGTSVFYGLSRNPDVDGNGTVDRADLNAASADFGCSIGQSCYNPRYDLNADGVINIVDIATIAIVFNAPNFI